jgi:hypothetical protein
MPREMSEPAPPTSALNQAEAIEALLGRLENAARSRLPAAEFFPSVVQDVVSALGAISGAIWAESDQGLQCQSRIGGGPKSAEELSLETEQRLAAATLLDGEVRWLAPGAQVSGEEPVENDSHAIQCLAPRSAEGVTGIVLRVGLRADASLSARETASGLLAAVSEIVLTFQLQDRLRNLHVQESFWRELDAAVLAIHAARGFTDCARTIAEQARRLLHSDRASVLAWRGSRCKLAAISSAADADRRARQVRLQERIATDAARSGGTFQFQVGDGSHAPRVSETVEAYLDETQLRTLRAEVLPRPGSDVRSPVGCLLVESFSAEHAAHWKERLAVLSPHCAAALDRALHEQSRGWRMLFAPLRSLSKTAVWLGIAGALAASVVALTVLQTDFTVEAPGRLMPAERRGVFAPADAIVSDLFVTDGAAVQVDQPLARLVDPELDLEQSRLSGELQTAAAKLDAVQARRKLLRGSRDADTSLLSIEEGELKATVSGLEEQLQVVERQRERLQIISPMHGRVSRWDLSDVLQSLPVRHGQMLLDVYDPDGPWRLELEIPDDVSGYVRLAAQEGQPRLEYVFQTEPGRVLTAQLDELSDATDVDAAGKLSVRGLVNLEPAADSTRQRGTTVTAKIHCGRRSIGFVWFREVIEFVQRRILF